MHCLESGYYNGCLYIRLYSSDLHIIVSALYCLHCEVIVPSCLYLRSLPRCLRARYSPSTQDLQQQRQIDLSMKYVNLNAVFIHMVVLQRYGSLRSLKLVELS